MTGSQLLEYSLTRLTHIAEFNQNGKPYKNVQHKKINKYLEQGDTVLHDLNSVFPDAPKNCLKTAAESVKGADGLQFFLFFIRNLTARVIQQAAEIDRLTAANDLLKVELEAFQTLFNQDNSSVASDLSQEDFELPFSDLEVCFLNLTQQSLTILLIDSCQI